MTNPFLIACAMEEEAAPFLAALSPQATALALPADFRGPTRFHSGSLDGTPVIVATTGIGLTNAAVAMTLALTRIRPRAVIFAGTTGGLGENVGLSDVIVASSALYHDADARAFGYQIGQIPQMPAQYDADVPLVAQSEGALRSHGIPFHAGQVSSGNSFVAGDQVPAVRNALPRVLAVDMETAAGAQVCHLFNIPWVSLRAVSDLCSSDAGEVFDESAPSAYERSFEAVSALLSTPK